MKNLIKNLLGTDKAKENLIGLVDKNSRIAEIGVWKGQFSKKIIKIAKPKKLYLIDPWEYIPRYKHRMYGGRVAVNQNDMDKIYKRVKKELDSKVVKILKSTSSEAAKKIKNNTLDLVYIDGNHSYQFVLEDLKTYYRKVKPGGYITGDDLLWNPMAFFPVLRALFVFIFKYNSQVRLLSVSGGQFILKKYE